MATGGVQRQLTLPPAPESARRARRFVAEVLSSARADDFIDTATLLTSELVTNGIVHAGTDLFLLVEATNRWVRIEVGDDSAHLPSRREYDESAGTGRGLEMLELLAEECGVEPQPDGGKRVWFRLGAVPGTPGPEHAPAAEAPSTFNLRLPQVPVVLYCAWQQHAEALLREATLAALDPDAPEAVGDYPLAGTALAALADAAVDVFALRDTGATVADVVLPISVDAVPFFPILRDLLNRAGSMSRAGQLLVPPSLPELDAIREWICDEIARQSAGLAPTPWAGIDTVDAPPPQVPLTVIESVRASMVAQVAADVSNRIIAVSEPAAELLGWNQADLEGRRLITIIPPRLRDQHIAGFTRHLLVGDSHMLGRPVPVPALHRDGFEIMVTLLIERQSMPTYQPLFVATLTPA